MNEDFNIEEALFGDAQTDLTKQRNALDQAFGVSPDQHSQVLSLSQKTGLDTDVIERNKQAVEKSVGYSDVDLQSIFDQTPEAKEWAADPDNMKLVSDDLSFFGRVKETLGSIDDRFSAGMTDTQISGIGAKWIDGQASPKDIILARELYKKNQDIVQNTGTGGVISEGVLALSQSIPGMVQSIAEGQKGGVASGLAVGGTALVAGLPLNAAPGVGTAANLTSATGLGVAAYGVGTTTFAIKDQINQQRGNFFVQLMSEPDENGMYLDEDTARAAANLYGMIAGPLDTFGLGKTLKAVPGGEKLLGNLTRQGIRDLLKNSGMRAALKRAGVDLAEAVVSEGSTEALQQIAQDLAANYVKEEANLRGGEFEKATGNEILSNAGRAFAIGAVASSGIALPGAATQVAIARKKYTRPEDIAAQAQALHQEVRSMPLMQRSPDRAHRLFQDIAGDERYYIDAEMVSQAVSALPEAQRQALFTAVPDLEVELSNAAETGADIAIKKADYAAFIAPYEQADILTEHLKLDPSEMSLSQRKTYTEFLAANHEVAAILRQTANEQPNVSTKEYEKAIERVVRKSITDAGRGMPEARVLAPLFAKSFARRAQAVGINPLEFFSQNLVGFQTVDANGNVVSKGSNINVLLSDLEKVRAGKGNSLDAATRQAINDFGSRLEQSGLTLPEAQALDPQQLIDRLYPKQDPAQADAQRLDQEQQTLPLFDDLADGIDEIVNRIDAKNQQIQDDKTRAFLSDRVANTQQNEVLSNDGQSDQANPRLAAAREKRSNDPAFRLRDRSLSAISDGSAQNYQRKSRVLLEQLGIEGEEFSPSPEAVSDLAAMGADAVTYYLVNGDGASKVFHEQISEAKARNSFGAAVEVKDVSEYDSIALYLTNDGKAGFGIKPDGDIVSVFKFPDKNIRRATASMLTLAIQNGGKKMDAFDTVLPDLYSKMGFRAVARMTFNEEYSPPGWDYQTFSDFNNGRPDVVFMALDALREDIYQKGEGDYITDWDDGVARQQQLIAETDDLYKPVEQTVRLMQSATAQAQRNGIGLYSMVEKQIMEMQLPQWKPSKQKLLTDEQRARLAELMQSATSTADPDYQERLNLATLERKEKGVAKGTEIWQKVEKLPVKKEELEWLGLKEFLTGSPNEDFTRDEVVEFVRSNGVQIEEIIADQEGMQGSIDWGRGEAIEDDDYIIGEAEYYSSEAVEGGSYEDEYFEIAKQVAEKNNDDEQTAAILAEDDDKSIAAYVAENYDDALKEAINEWAMGRANDVYWDDPIMRYTTDNGDELTGHNNIGWSLRRSNGRSEFLDAYSLNEAQIRANDRLMESGDYTSEDSPDAKKWEDYTTPGSYDNYRERKLTLPGVEGDFYYDTHFPDRNIVAFSRETDRWLSTGVPDGVDIDDEIPDAEPIELNQETGKYSQKNEDAAKEKSFAALMESYAIAGKEPDPKRDGEFTAWEIILRENMIPLINDAQQASREKSGMDGTYQKATDLQNKFYELRSSVEEYRFFLQEKRRYQETVTKSNTLEGKIARSKYGEKKRTFFIDEFQSDWHQQGRSEGYEGEPKKVEVRQNAPGTFSVYASDGNVVYQGREKYIFDTKEEAEAFAEQYRKNNTGDIAQAPFKGDGWLALGLKRALVDAVEKGYDRFAWADADVLADRWSERYRTLYETQYDTKMPSAVKRLTGVQPQHVMNSRELRGQGYWYIDIDEKLRNEIRGNSFPLFQDARGYIDFEDGLRKVVITFTEKANFSTGVHEFSHWAVASHRMFADVARQKIAEGDDNPELQRIVDDWEALKRKVGATGDKFTVDQEEMVARMFEAYMREGNAPSEEMRSVFTRFRDWLTKIYQDMTRLGYDLDDETRGVFDRWLAAENEIQKLKDKNQTFAMIAQQLGLSPEVQTKIADYVNGALVKAEEKLFRELKSEQKARDSAEYKDAFAKMRVKVAEEFEKQKEYALVKYMRDNGFKFLEGPETINVQSDILAKQEDNATTVPPDDVAEMFGYKSGQEMLKKLKNLTNFDRAVDYETRKRMQADYPDMAASGKIGDVALDAMYNDRTLLALDTMINEIGKATGQNRVNMRQFAKVLAQQQLMKMRLDETGYAFRWDAARDKEMRNALQFARNKAPQMAMLSLQKAMVNHMLFKQLNQFNQEKEKAYDLFKRVNAKDKTLAPSSDIDFVGAARGILHKFGMAREGFDIAQWLDDVNERDPSIRQDLIGMVNMVRVQPKPAKDLTVAEFIDIRDAVTNIMWVARSLKKIERDGKEIEREKIIMQLTQQLDGLPQSRRKTLTQTSGDKLRSWAMSFKSSTRRVEQWVNAIDGGFGGVTRTNIWDPIVTADNQYKDERPKWFRELNKILQASKDHIEQRGKIDAPELSSDMFGGVFRDRLELIGWLLHTGNESNMEKLLDGYGINRANWDAFLTRAYNQQIITDKDMKVVQDLWNFAERLKPMSQRAHKKLYGYRFDEIEPMPITTPFGTYAGGYWPAIVDYSLVEDGDIRQAQDQANGIGNSYMIPATGKGFTMKRVDGYRRPLSVDLRLATGHIDKVLRFSILEPAVRDVSRIVNNKDYRDVLQRVDEFAGRNMLNPWLQRVARQETEMPLGQNWKWMAPASRFLRSSASAQTMMLNLLNAMQNVTGFSVSIYKVGVGNWMRANMRYAMNPFEANREVRALSTEMRVRQNIEDIDITNAVNDIILRRGKVLKAKNWAIKHGYVFQRLIQNYVDNVTWMAAFDQHSAEGNDQAASIRYADSIVRTTQGSTSARDISSIEAGSAPAKLFLMFYSYFNNISNLIGTEATTIIRRAGWKGAPELFYMYLMTAAIPFFMSEFIVKGARDALPEDEDDDGLLDEYLAWFGMSQVRGTFAAVPYAGQVANAFMNRHNDQPMDDRISISPVVSLTETTVRFLDESLFDDGYNDNSRMVRDALTAIGFMTGLPLGQFGKPVGYIADVQEGDTEPENVVDFGMGLIAGPPPANR